MYGLVNKGIEQLICDSYGEQTWEEIKKTAGVEAAGFVSMQPYDDQITYRLVEAASQVLGVPGEEILETFGTHWVIYTVQKGYGEMLNLAGDNFVDFVKNLDELHTRVGLLMPDLDPPSFEVEELGENRLIVRYYSTRRGLTPMIAGLLRGLALRFQVQADIALAAGRSEKADYDEFFIHIRGEEA
ncbi:heme NO-binding domain-containing protein [Ectobacillus ponti]|uniref:Heme NO-binding domain-containing protein n=1 Tax=Ectobacillus ponti TaxID=2961894 RepID=A0AA41X9Q1_9BACI|nr:heme NO-binding domain-containing protein [Ectobacillus ponti]MCP8968940.1 heme NO-binding domain-containing protein [Ectobacillus ponti]